MVHSQPYVPKIIGRDKLDANDRQWNECADALKVYQARCRAIDNLFIVSSFRRFIIVSSLSGFFFLFHHDEKEALGRDRLGKVIVRFLFRHILFLILFLVLH